MNRPEFERRLAELRARISELPAEQRAALESLAMETAERHEQIARSALEGHRAVERLEFAFARLRAACLRFTALTADAQAALASAQRSRPGLN